MTAQLNRGPAAYRWRVRDLPYRITCDRCGLSIVRARAETRPEDVAFVCEWHELPDDMPAEEAK